MLFIIKEVIDLHVDVKTVQAAKAVTLMQHADYYFKVIYNTPLLYACMNIVQTVHLNTCLAVPVHEHVAQAYECFTV
jgi:hypothetical protein